MLIPLGLILVCAGVGIVLMIEIGLARGTTNWRGNNASLYFVYGLLGLIATAGLSVIITGIWQIVTGAANMKLIRTLMILFGALWLVVVAGRLIITVLSD